MKTLIILNLCLFIGTNSFAQKDFEITPPDNCFNVSSYIFNDGSFEIYSGNMVYPYDANGEVNGEPYEFRDDVKVKAEFNIPGSILIDKSTDTRYAFEPITYLSMTQTKTNTGVILIDKLGKRNQERVEVKFEDVVAVKTYSAATNLYGNLYSYLDGDNNPNFMRVCKGISKQDPSYFDGQKMNKKKVNSFIERIEVDKKTNTAKVTTHLINKTPAGYSSSNVSILHFIGAMNGKLFVALEYRKKYRDTVFNIDIWSIDEKTGEEKMEHTYTYSVDDTPNESLLEMHIYSDPNTSGLFFQHCYSKDIPKGQRTSSALYYSASYIFLEITPLLEFKVSSLDIPPSVLSHNSTPPPLNVYKSGSITHFFLSADGGNTLIFTREDNGPFKMKVITLPNTTVTDKSILFEDELSPLYEQIETVLFTKDEICKYCRLSRYVNSRLDGDNIRHFVYCNDLRDCGMNNCRVEHIRVHVESEEIK